VGYIIHGGLNHQNYYDGVVTGENKTMRKMSAK
jgi:hypothetical protein